MYPAAYMLVGRLLLAPFWDFISLFWKVGKWVAGLYDKAGITPDSIPHDYLPDPTFWSNLFAPIINLSKFAQEVGSKPA